MATFQIAKVLSGFLGLGNREPDEAPKHILYRLPRSRKSMSMAQQKRAKRKRSNIRKRPSCAR